MGNNETKRRAVPAILAAALALAFAATQPLYAARLAAADRETPIEDGPVDGAGLGEWTARWWQWALAQWVEPYRDPDGRLCALGQDGAVWFLAGTDGTFDALRRCTVPAGKHVLVPVINMIHHQVRRGVGPGCRALQAAASVNNDHLVSAVVLLDGKPLGDVSARRVRSAGCFPLDPDDEASPLAASDGYWIMLRPLPPGRHRLVVGANYGAPDEAYGGMRQNFEYVLDVGGPLAEEGNTGAPAAAPLAPR